MLTTNKDANFVNSLAGKVAGVNINASSSGTGGISKVVMRGTKSIMQSSNALYVVDGVPMRSASSEGDAGAFGSKGATEPIADLNPDDVESMSVLTGAAAAALYGSAAANGAIVITTKKVRQERLRLQLVRTSNGIVHGFCPDSKAATAQVKTVFMPPLHLTAGVPASHRTTTTVTMWLMTSCRLVLLPPIRLLSLRAPNATKPTLRWQLPILKVLYPTRRYNRYNFNYRNTSKFLNDKMTLDLNAKATSTRWTVT